MENHRAERLYRLGVSVPDIDARAWVAPNAIVVGDVTIGSGTSVWYGSVIRGDANKIVIGCRTNVQDLSMVHADPGDRYRAVIGDDVTIGHGCIIHGCRIGNNVLVGMRSTILNDAEIEPFAMLAAGSLLTSGKRVPTNELWAGSPARFLRKLTADDVATIEASAAHYVRNADRFLRTADVYVENI